MAAAGIPGALRPGQLKRFRPGHPARDCTSKKRPTPRENWCASCAARCTTWPWTCAPTAPRGGGASASSSRRKTPGPFTYRRVRPRFFGDERRGRFFLQMHGPLPPPSPKAAWPGTTRPSPCVGRPWTCLTGFRPRDNRPPPPGTAGKKPVRRRYFAAFNSNCRSRAAFAPRISIIWVTPFPPLPSPDPMDTPGTTGWVIRAMASAQFFWVST
jgi:hypothetical protein